MTEKYDRTIIHYCKLKINETAQNNTTNSLSQYRDEHYLTATFFALRAAGLGNKLFEVVSIFGAAHVLNRTPFIPYDLNDRDTLEKFALLVDIFPNLVDAYRIKLMSRNGIIDVGIGGGRCCYYDDLEKYRKYDAEKYILTNANYLQSYKYFLPVRNKLLEHYLQFSQTYINEAIALRSKFFKTNDSDHNRHSICVHLRRGDFVGNPLSLPSDSKFAQNSIKFVRDRLRKTKPTTAIIVFLIGSDEKFAQTIVDTDNTSIRIVPADHARPAVHWAFAVQYCKSIIQTAPASTFGWWMAYLSSNATIYYNTKYSTPGGIERELVRADFFPPEWIPLTMSDNGTVTIDK